MSSFLSHSQMYQFLPALIAPTLSSIAVLCLIDNRNSTFRILSSGYHGLGFLNISLDWNAAGMTGPLYQPWVRPSNLPTFLFPPLPPAC